MTSPTASPRDSAAVLPARVVAEPRQRWRLTFSRQPVASDAVGRVALGAWQNALVASGLPLAGLEPGGAGQARIAFAAPLPATACGEAELVDLWLLERRAAWVVREALADRLPDGHSWIAAESVWLGAPALAGRIIAADWRVSLEDSAGMDRERLGGAARAILAAATLPRVRVKGGSEKRYDLRPLLADVSVIGDAVSGLPSLRIRTRLDPELGSGRPEEVVAALADAAGVAIAIGMVTRQRLLLADDLPNPPAAAPAPRARPARR